MSSESGEMTQRRADPRNKERKTTKPEARSKAKDRHPYPGPERVKARWMSKSRSSRRGRRRGPLKELGGSVAMPIPQQALVDETS